MCTCPSFNMNTTFNHLSLLVFATNHMEGGSVLCSSLSSTSAGAVLLVKHCSTSRWVTPCRVVNLSLTVLLITSFICWRCMYRYLIIEERGCMYSRRWGVGGGHRQVEVRSAACLGRRGRARVLAGHSRPGSFLSWAWVCSRLRSISAWRAAACSFLSVRILSLRTLFPRVLRGIPNLSATSWRVPSPWR